MKYIPLMTCPKLWSSQPKRIVAQTVTVILFFTIALPLIILLFPIALVFWFCIVVIHATIGTRGRVGDEEIAGTPIPHTAIV